VALVAALQAVSAALGAEVSVAVARVEAGNTNVMKKEIQLGFTFDYFIPGVLLIIIGGVSCIGSIPIGVVMILSGVALLLLKTSIEIDTGNKRIRKFYALFSLRFGSWISTERFPKATLSLTNESRTILHRGGQTTTRTRTYDIIFHDDAGALKEMNDFRSYDKAVLTLGLIAELLQLQVTNKVEEARGTALKRRREQGRK
jgi:hypothetical protein